MFSVRVLPPPSKQRTLPFIKTYVTLYLNKFRGKPAISKFD
jgi:hypothetical protein